MSVVTSFKKPIILASAPLWVPINCYAGLKETLFALLTGAAIFQGGIDASVGTSTPSMVIPYSAGFQNQSFPLMLLPNSSGDEVLSTTPPASEGTWNRRFLLPNEFKPYRISEALMNKAHVLVGVGSFRVLFDAGMANFSRVYMIDYNPLVVNFNIAHLELIRAIANTLYSARAQRLLYLTIMSHRSLSQDELYHYSKRGQKDEYRLFDNWIDLIQSRPITEYDPTLIPDLDPSIVENVQAHLSSAMSDHLLYWCGSKQNQAEVCSQTSESQSDQIWFDHLNALHRGGRNRSILFWETERAWKKITGLIKNGRVVVHLADLTSAQSMAKIGQTIRSENETVSVLDISNAMEHFQGSDEKKLEFEEGIEQLPSCDDSVLVSTQKVTQFANSTRKIPYLDQVRQGIDPWSYSVQLLQFFEFH